MTKTSLIVLLGLISSCANIFSGNPERKLQTQVHAQINEKASQFRQCALDHKLFKAINSNRVRMVLFLDINSKGGVEKFKLDNAKYSEKFTDCIFNTVELISFPKFDSHEIISVEQPFIFSKK